MIDFDEYYDALIQRLQKTDKGMEPKYLFILWAISVKIVGLFAILAIMTIILFDVPLQYNFPEIKFPTPAPMVVTQVTPTEEIRQTETLNLPEPATLEPATPEPATPEPATPTPVIQITPSIMPTISRLDASDASQNVEIGIPLSGFTAEELPLIISQQFSVTDEHRDVGHHGVDLGFYDYKGKYILDLPIDSIFAGTVAGIVHDRPPLGFAVVVETPYNNLPDEYRKALNIQSDESLYILYAHMVEAPRLLVGDSIAWQQQIGNVGKSQTAEAHLHLETRIGKSGFTFNSMAFYDTSASDEEMKTYLRWRTSGDFRPFDPMKLFTEMYHE
jgi:murein DD-endopeptidase MepM/ murein hydrolase activator NlpD